MMRSLLMGFLGAAVMPLHAPPIVFDLPVRAGRRRILIDARQNRRPLYEKYRL